MSDCMYEQLCSLGDDPDDLDTLNSVILGHEGVYDADDESVTDHFICQKAGCMGQVAITQWFDESTNVSGSAVKMLSGECISGIAKTH